MSKKEIYGCVLDMVLCLRQVHQNGIVHMDVKPDNFLVKADNTIRLCDFGLAVDVKEVEKGEKEDSVARVKGHDVSEGDASYLAPELLQFNVKVTPKVDVFSLGLSLIEMFNISGIKKLPQNGEIWNKVRELNPSTFIRFPYKDLGDLVDNMTKKNPEDRYSIDQILSSTPINQLYSKHPSTQTKVKILSKPLQNLLTHLESTSPSDFSKLLKKLQSQIKTHALSKPLSSSKLTQTTDPSPFETPQATKMSTRIAHSSSIHRHPHAPEYCQYTNSALPKAPQFQTTLLKFRNPTNISKSLKRVLQQLNPGQLRNLQNSQVR